MKRVLNFDKLLIAILWLVIIIIFFFTYGKYGSLYVDCGREVYIPWQMLKGDVLYKDIFNIYAPGAYLYNAFLYKLFTPNLNVLYLSAMFTYCGISTLLYLLARLFLSKKTAISLSLIIILFTCFSGNVFNFFFPYSFAVIYGMFFVLCSLYFLLKRNKKDSDYYLSALFAGIALINKYEYIPFVLPLLYLTIIHFKSVRKILYSLCLLCSVPIISFLFLFLQGLTFVDILKEVYILRNILESETFKFFYSATGLTLSIEHISFLFRQFLSVLVAFIIAQKIEFNLLKYPLLLFVCYLAKNIYLYRLLVFVPFLIVILFVWRYKSLSNNIKAFFWCYIAIVLKVFSSLMLFSYGVFFVGISLIMLFALLPIKFRRSSLIVMFVYSIFLLPFSFATVKLKDKPLALEQGYISQALYLQEPFAQVYEYLKQNSIPEDVILAFPEMPLLNFLLQRDNDNYLYSLIPMYIEVFGEQNIINRIDESEAKYIVLNEFSMNSYGVDVFGKDYALNIMRYITQNYDKLFETENGLKHYVYRRK